MSHWSRDLTDVPASVRERLRNIARETGENMQVLLIRYATERWMYRLARTDQGDRFVLKGAWLFYLWGIPRRATRDVDFLAQTSKAREQMRELLREVAAVEVPCDDGLRFDSDEIRIEEIQEGRQYAGLRVKTVAHLGRTTIPTQIDIGFDETLTAEPVIAELPVLLDYEAPKIRVYGHEAVVAEKLEAIVKLGVVNTRFKDFFDLYILSRERTFDGNEVRDQIAATFSHRGTELATSVPTGLSDAFGRDDESQRQWAAFLRRHEAQGAPDGFIDVVVAVREFVHPPLEAAAAERRFGMRWTPEDGWVGRAE